ncbi:uncharacterized protein BN660_01150 [Clostridium sp. CAG:448]|nr:uncharacterized protein BN660_01150 [Clostridium sp. CAG:448]
MVLSAVMRSQAYSVASRATVRMVPSTGVPTAPYARRTPERNASPTARTSASSMSAKPIAMPANSWERMTPELPRAPKSMPCAILSDCVARDSETSPAEAVTPPSMVILMLSPVSPSGMGNTFRLFTISALARRSCAPPQTISRNWIPLILLPVISMFASLLLTVCVFPQPIR